MGGEGKAVLLGMIKSSLTGKGSIKEVHEDGKGMSHTERALQLRAGGPAGAKALRRVHGCQV